MVDSGGIRVVSLLTRQGSWEPDKEDYAVLLLFSIVTSLFHYGVMMNLL